MADVKEAAGVVDIAQGRGQMPAALKITCHRLIGRCGGGKERTLLYKDLFDSNPAVIISALTALAELKDTSCLKHVCRLLTHGNTEIQCAAIDMLGKSGEKRMLDVLIRFFKSIRDEQIKRAVIQAITGLGPQEREVKDLVRTCVISRVLKPETRAIALSSLLQIENGEDTAGLIGEIVKDLEAFKYFVTNVEKSPAVIKQVLHHCVNSITLMSATQKISLLSFVGRFDCPRAKEILFTFLSDNSPEVRVACYRAIQKGIVPAVILEHLVSFLSIRVESVMMIEEEAHTAIEGICRTAGQNKALLRDAAREQLFGQIESLYVNLTGTDGIGVSDNHELGWLSRHAKEYLEYYADEDLKHAVVQHLKGRGGYSTDELLRLVQKTAEKVEVRHFEGYRALLNLIKNPSRHGIALVIRHLNLAKLGKRLVMYKLIRNLKLIRLFTLPCKKDLFLRIYRQAKNMKLYRLAEAALGTLAAVDLESVTAECMTCITPPIESKILAIASIHILKKKEWSVVEPAFTRLLEGGERYVILNLIDAVSSLSKPPSGRFLKMILERFNSENDEEIASRLGGLLGEKSDLWILGGLFRIMQNISDWKQNIAMSIIERIVTRFTVSDDLELSEFLYGVLRKGISNLKPQVLSLLYRIGDDYAIKEIASTVQDMDVEKKTAFVRSLKGSIRKDIIPVIQPYLYEEHANFQEALRDTLITLEDTTVLDEILQSVLHSENEPLPEVDKTDTGNNMVISLDFSKEKSTYRFEREYIKRCAVFFSDISDYTKKAQQLTSMELASLIQEYESIILPIISQHEGELIKRMGDGHLCVFSSPLNAVVAGIRVQKALKRFNSFREEKKRIVVRIGIHYGDVVRENGDIFGNTVNIASRLESSADSGSILISDEIFSVIKRYVYCREIGPITVKGVNVPLCVYAPYEIAIDFPSELDPERQKNEYSEISVHESNIDTFDVSKRLQGDGGDESGEYRKQLEFLKGIFDTLDSVCVRLERGECDAAYLRKFVAQNWKIVYKRFS